MKPNNLRRIIPLFFLLVCYYMFSSFAVPNGGEGFEIYINNKLLVQKIGNDMKNIPLLSISGTSMNDKVSIRYFHCGRLSRNRIIMIKDENDILVTQWKFDDESNTGTLMTFAVKDLLRPVKNNVNKVNLFYTSSELTAGRLLAKIDILKKEVPIN